MNKEELLDDIEFIEFFYGDNLIATAELRKEKTKEFQEEDKNNLFKRTNRIKQLIHEHFDNPPLKFEDLKENMVVWDNETKIFIKIFDVATLEENCFSYEVFGWEVPIYDEHFEENRFYRKQV